MDRLAIKAALKKVGLTQAAIARRCGCSPVTVHLVIARKTNSRRIKMVIAEALGKQVDHVFP